MVPREVSRCLLASCLLRALESAETVRNCQVAGLPLPRLGSRSCKSRSLSAVALAAFLVRSHFASYVSLQEAPCHVLAACRLGSLEMVLALPVWKRDQQNSGATSLLQRQSRNLESWITRTEFCPMDGPCLELKSSDDMQHCGIAWVTGAAVERTVNRCVRAVRFLVTHAALQSASEFQSKVSLRRPCDWAFVAPQRGVDRLSGFHKQTL